MRIGHPNPANDAQVRKEAGIRMVSNMAKEIDRIKAERHKEAPISYALRWYKRENV